MEATALLPEAKDIHVIKAGAKSLVLDVMGNKVFRVDPNFGEFLQGSKLGDGDPENVLHNRLAMLRQHGIFEAKEVEISDIYHSPVYKLSIEAFHGCNLGCLYCYGKASGVYHNNRLKPDYETLKRIIDFFIRDFGRTARSYEINIVGAGEPLLNFDLVKRLRAYCRAIEEQIGKTVVFWVFTNGTVFTEEIVDYFIQEKQGLTISLDGPAAIHDRLRPFPNGTGSHSLIAGWIQQILERSKGKGGLEHLWVSTVITAQHPSLKEIIYHFQELGIRNAQIRPIKTLDPGLTLLEDDIERLITLYEEMVADLLEKAAYGEIEALKIILNDRDFWGRHVIRAFQGQKINYRCGAAKSKLCILANGDIYPCDISCDIHQLKLGDVTNGIAEPKRDPFYAQAVSGKSGCKDCWCRFYCGGGCYVAAMVHNGDISEPDRNKCRLVKRLVELALWFISELQTRSQENYGKVKRYIEIQQKVMDRIYGLSKINGG